jgi:superfamily II DNA or RNA helicase
MKLRLYAWQEECLKIWLDNGCKGIVNVVTGAGKTALAAAAIERLMIEKDSLRVKIVVPKTFLVRQWSRALMEYLQVPREDIGIYSGSRKSDPDRKFMIYVINSARHSLARHTLNDLLNLNPVLLVADECHHYGTEENAKIFDFYPWRLAGRPGGAHHAHNLLIASNTPVYTLGLSATPFCEHFTDILVPCLGSEIYRFSFYNALSADIINRFAVFHVCLRFTAYEQELYDEFTDKIIMALAKLRKHNPDTGARDSSSFFLKLRRLAGKGGEASELAKAVLLLTYQRKNIVYHANSRVRCVYDLVRLIRKDAKIIIFGERIETADEIYRGLNDIFPNESGIYHSGKHKNVGESALKRFEDGEIRILISCRTLDEGLSVTSADVAVIVSSTSSARQRIQRLGRILRKKDNGRRAYFYYLYIDGTTEETDFLQDHTRDLETQVSFMYLNYDDRTGEFSNNFYSQLVEAAKLRAAENAWSDEMMRELERNFRKGLITSDWWLTEEECEENIRRTKDKSERNYYTAISYLIRERIR